MKLTKTISLAAAVALTMGGILVTQSGALAAQSPAAPPLVMVPGQNGEFQENFSPFSGSALSGTQGLIYQPLFYFNPAGKADGLIGQSFAWSDGNKLLTVHLRSGVRWSDGVPLTAQDVVFSFDLLKKYPQLDGSGIWKQISSVNAVGTSEVEFHFSTVNTTYEYYILGSTYIVPAHIWAKVGDPTKSLNLKPVGTGPFVMHSFTPEMYTMDANPLYWGGKPQVPEVEFPAYSGNESTTLALINGKIDWTGLFIPHIHRVYVSKDPQYNQFWFSPYGGANMIYTNLKDPILSSLAVRQAISLALDRNKISQFGEYGYEPPASPTGYDLPPAGQVWIKPSLPKQFAYNPQMAIDLLQKAGFKKNASGMFQTAAGKPLSLTLDVVSGWTDWDADCALVAQELGQIGIDVSVQQLAFGAYYQDISTGHFQLAMSWSGSGPTPFYMYQPMLQPGNAANMDGWSNPYTTRLINNYEHTSNTMKQRQDVYALETSMVYSLPYIPLVYGVGWNEYSTKNYVGWPSASDPYAAGSPWISPANGIVLSHLRPRL
ncbi:MAG: ABC transporter substrate-binding protein [Firmicutes bacterium]|nr:ABC transporter substrate-binding protein [Bacillota bacterium]